MRLGSFELNQAIPELKAPHAIVVLRPWIDAGNAGTLAIARLENTFGAMELGKLARPGNFFDFTRYRPEMFWKDGVRQITIPNTIVTYARREEANDFVFIHLFEPHMHGEVYTASILALLQKLGVQRYCLIGSMYDMVPHTRRLMITGGAVGKKALQDLDKAEVGVSDYEGPTTICHLISQQAELLGVETMTMIAHLPQYTELDQDYVGQVRLMDALGSIYGFTADPTDIREAEKQTRDIDIAVNRNQKIKKIVAQLEAHYDARLATRKNEEMPRLSPEIESFLREMEKRFRQG
jgi:hypothetical protein